MIYFEADYVGEVYDLEHPRILWNSIGRRASVAVSTEAEGFAGANAVRPTTYDTWKPTALPATWTLTFDAAEPINAIAIDTHSCGSSGATVTVQEWDGAAWQDVVFGAPADDEPMAFLFKARTTDRIRLSIAGSVVPYLAMIHCSYALELPQRVYQRVATPVDMAFQSEFDTTQSAQGQYLGRSVARRKNKNSFTVAHLTEAWVRATLMPFVLDAREHPYFLLERPYTQPAALSYRWMDGDIRPERMGALDFMQVAL